MFFNRPPIYRWLPGAALLGSMLFIGPLFADEYDRAEQALQRLGERIADIRERLGHARNARDIQQLKLAEIELRIGLVARQLAAVERQLAGKKQALVRLGAERNAWQLELADQRLNLGRAMRAAYATGRQSQLKVLLNQENPALIARVLTFHDYFNRDRVRRIRGMERAVKRLRDVAAAINQQRAALDALKTRHTKTRARLSTHREERRNLVAYLNQEIAASGTALGKMNADKRAIEKLLDELQQRLADITDDQQPRPFAEQRGQLAWPVIAPLRHRFGEQRDVPGMAWQGVILAAPAGRPVRAVAAGRVAFADWLRGFGLLVVLDHGDGYLTLYGHARSLYVEVGEWVEAGARVATVGDSGGQSKPGLYFAVRNQGKPVDPRRWCRPLKVAGRN